MKQRSREEIKSVLAPDVRRLFFWTLFLCLLLLYLRAFVEIRYEQQALYLKLQVPSFLHRGKAASNLLAVIPPSHPLVYVANSGSSDLSVLDGVSYEPVGEIHVGDGPADLLLTPDRKWLVAGHLRYSSLAMINTMTNRVEKWIPLGTPVQDLAMNKEGTLVAALGLRGADERTEILAVVDLRSRGLLGRERVANGARKVFFSPGGEIVVLNSLHQTLSIFSPERDGPHQKEPMEATPPNGRTGGAKRIQSREIKVRKLPRDLIFSPDGSLAYVACFGEHRIVILDARTFKEGRPAVLVNTPSHIALTPNGILLLAISYLPNKLFLYRRDPPRFLDSIEFPVRLFSDSPSGIVMHPDGKRAYVVDYAFGYLYPLDLVTREVGEKIKVGEHPVFAAFDPQGKRLLVCNRGSNSVSVVDPGTSAVLAQVFVKKDPTLLVFR